jgi:hypothetical protein
MSRSPVRAGEVHTVSWGVNLKEKDHLEVLDVDARIFIIFVGVGGTNISDNPQISR